MKTPPGQASRPTRRSKVPPRNNQNVLFCLPCVDNPEGDCRLEIEEMQRRRRIRLSASLLEVGTVGDEQSTFVPKQGTRGDLEHSNADMVVLLHQRRGAADGDGGNRDRGAPLSRAWSRTDEEAGGRNADVVVMLCGPVSCTCEELRHRSVPTFPCCLIWCAPYREYLRLRDNNTEDGSAFADNLHFSVVNRVL